MKKTLRDTCQGDKKSHGLLLAAGLVLGILACGRTRLDPADLDPFGDEFETGGTGGTSSAPPSDASTGGTIQDAEPDAEPDSSTTPDGSTDPTVPEPDPNEPPTCTPEPETCNGRDDDCNGEVDELPGEPCPGGGFRYCVAGRFSDCPRSCEVCVPGSIRICQNSYCTYWGEQECAADGQGFGPCREGTPPPRCASIARNKHDSPELERCCIDDGYCCLDAHDLDGDGNRRDMLGACDGVRCQ